MNTPSFSLQLNKFDTATLCEHRRGNSTPVICVIGKRNTGKSEIIKSILYANKDIPSGIVISPTENGNRHYTSFCPSLFIHDAFDSSILQKILQRQKRLIKKHGKHPRFDFFIILDDCMYNAKQVCKDTSIREIFSNGRHYQIFIILSVQYIMDLALPLRSNIDYVFCLRENNIQNCEKLYTSFFGVFPNKNTFIQTFMTVTDNYGCIVANNLSRSNKINECVYWYRALYPCPPFKIGSSKYWKIHSMYIKTSDSDNDDENNNNKKTIVGVNFG